MDKLYSMLNQVFPCPVPPIIPDGSIHRFGPNKAYWAFVHAVGGHYFGACGNWKTGEVHKLASTDDAHMNHHTRAAINQAISEQAQQHEAERTRQHTEAAHKAANIWREATAPTATSYTRKKRIQAHGAKQIGQVIILPLVDAHGQLWSIQRIFPDGSKRFLTGGRKHGCFIPVVWPNDLECLIICEGWATGCSLADMNPGASVVAACDAGNPQPVAKALHTAHPWAPITIAADADEVGISKATMAAQSIGCKAISPTFPPGAPEHLTDFNDLAVFMAGVTA